MNSSTSPDCHTGVPSTSAGQGEAASTLPSQFWSGIGLLDLIHDAVLARDMEGRIVYWNHSAEEHYGWKQTEAIGQIAQELLRNSFPIPFPQIEEQLLRTGRWEGRVSHIDRSGNLLLVDSRFALMRDEQGGASFHR